MSHQQHELRSAVPIAGPSSAHHGAAGQADVQSSAPVTPGPASGSVTPGGQAYGQSGHTTLPAVPSDPALSASASRDQQAAAKQSLKQWWTKFTKQQQQQQGGSGYSKRDDAMSGKGVFGVPMIASLKYAGVAISMVGPDGVNQVYGYIPIVVAKCGLFLKQKATTVEGVFRISGSTRRMKELQDIFDRPPSYGRDVVWGPWSVHDAASVLRRYLNQMPEPVVPYELYDEFRNALPPPDKAKDPAAINASILRYKALIACLPSSSKYLLCYVLDLLNVFARNHEFNLMPATNLSVVFQPGLIRPPDHEPMKTGIAIPGANADGANDPMSPPTFPQLSRSSSNPLNNNPLTNSSTESTGTTTELQRRQDEIKINQEVLAFLINHQDHFVALPEPMSSSEVSPVTPTNSSSLPPRPPQSQAQAASHQGGPVDGASSAKPRLPLGSVNQANANAAVVAVPSQPMQPKQATQPTQQSAGPPRGLDPEPSKHSAINTQPGTLPGPQIRANVQPIQSSTQGPPANRREMPQTPLSPGMPISPSAETSLPAAAFPASSSAAPKKSSKTKESDKDERKPRKLKKGRTPTSSGTSTPLSPPLQGQSGNAMTQHHNQQRPVIHTSSDAPTPIYDEDTPLQAAGPGVKRSRTLPSPGADRTASPRSVGSRRQSESRPSPQPLTPEARDRATPSPLRSPVPLPRTAPLSATSSRPSTARSQVFADSGVDQSEDSDTGAGTSERKGKGWRTAFRREKDAEGPFGKETSLRVPTSTGLQPSRSTQSSRSHDGSSARDVYAAGKEAVTLQQRRPSASSTARSDQGEGFSASQQLGQLRAVRNPPLQGAGSKRDGKKKADENAAISAEAIRDAVANIGRG